MSIPPKYNYKFYEGDDDEMVIRYKDSNGDGIDLSNDDLKVQFKDKEGNVVLESEGIVTPTVNYEVTFPIIAIETIGLAGESTMDYCYDIQRTYNSGSSIETLVKGCVLFFKEVTV